MLRKFVIVPIDICCNFAMSFVRSDLSPNHAPGGVGASDETRSTPLSPRQCFFKDFQNEYKKTNREAVRK